jgi:hypothetical protein
MFEARKSCVLIFSCAKDDKREDGNWPISDDTGEFVIAPGWRFEKPVRGWWTAVLTTKKNLSRRVLRAGPPPTGRPDAYLLLWNDSPERLFSHLGTYWWNTGKTVGVTSNLFLQQEGVVLAKGEKPAALVTPVILSANLDIYTPTGSEVTVKMSDDGQSFDALANDNIYGGKFVAEEEGMYVSVLLFC